MTAFYVFLLLVRVATGVISPTLQCEVYADYGCELWADDGAAILRCDVVADYGVEIVWDLVYSPDGLWLLELETAYNVTVVCDGWAPAYIELAGGYQWVVLEPATLPLNP